MEMDQMKTRFFSNISHELRTPLTLISGPLEDMLISGIEDETEREKVEMMYRNSLRILGLINQLMDLSKIDAGSLKLELVQYNIVKVLKMIARSFTPL
jgi:signal transduction histidine kinase